MTTAEKPTPSAMLRELADYIETVPAEQFNYARWSHPCGSPACAAGHACTLWPHLLKMTHAGTPTLVADPHWGAVESLAHAIGIDWELARALFHPWAVSPILHRHGPASHAPATEVAAWLRLHADALEREVKV